jgi:uncharacterized membrane protein
MRMAAIVILGAFLTACGPDVPPADGNTPQAEVPASAAVERRPGTTGNQQSDVAGTQETGACRMQGGKEIPANRLKALGTEPFWSAVIDGRCVTYSTPENQAGTRLWTAFTGSRDAGQWAGFLGRDRFLLVTRPDPDCSDGMSDRTYPIAVTLTIGTEERRGCAAPE